MKAEQNTITSSRRKERRRKGTERRKSLCEKTIDKTKTYDNRKNPNMSAPSIFLKETLQE